MKAFQLIFFKISFTHDLVVVVVVVVVVIVVVVEDFGSWVSPPSLNFFTDPLIFLQSWKQLEIS